MAQLRVLQVIPSVSPLDGGPSAAISLIERGLSRAGINTITLTTDHGITDSRSDQSNSSSAYPCYRIYAHKRFGPYKVAPGMLPWLFSNISAFDVVHIHALFSFAPTMAAWAARWHGVPYIIRPLGTLSQYGMSLRRRRLKRASVALIERPILTHAAAVHFTARSEFEEAKELGIRFRGVVIPIGLEPTLNPTGTDLRLAHPQLAGRSIVLFLSRIDPKKNLEALIDAFAASSTLQAGSALVIAGSGAPKYVETLKARAAAAGVDRLLIWLGHVEGAAKAAAFRAASVFALPSFSENLGIAAIEAMLAGLPCVLGRGVAVADEAMSANAGLAVSPDPAAMARALEELLGDADLRHEMAKQARALADRSYSLDGMTERLIDLYREVRHIQTHDVSHTLRAR
jgi:glycosyltransferase involved in cell wall biosynthesis